MNDKAIRAAAKEIERHKMEPWTDTKAVEIARDAIAAYEAAMWRPIEEIPEKWKDGRHLLVAFAEPPYHAFWTFDQRPATVAHFWEGEGAPDRGWYLSVSWYEQETPLQGVTHVCPLPAAPESEG